MGSKVEIKENRSKQSLKDGTEDLKKSPSENLSKEKSLSQTQLSKQSISTTDKNENDANVHQKEPDLKTKILSGSIPEKEHCTVLTEEASASDICNLAGLPAYCKIVKAAIKMENQDTQPRKSRIDLASLPTRQYLDQTVVPILMNALSHLAKERPPEPIAALAAYLLKNRSNFEQIPSETNSPPAEPETAKNNVN
ncbi:uncharacterized protein LOC123684856 isoform X1 [Harmonia axyridis]|uniref:uncharacterized protein LOC123684856 isoform X1 n=2 Tax=Harmonia axyridis TaxID=115357 RepID=UPI001E279D6F|nr:uncharacterized protein LOC123684856 isoform X1 [Harmonia axyridis]